MPIFYSEKEEFGKPGGDTIPRIPFPGGRLTNRYRGDPNELYARFRIQHARDFSWGFTLDKDAGEEFLWDPPTKRYGFNFFSYHVTLYQKGKWKTIALGDFQAQFGQGFGIWIRIWCRQRC